MFSREIRYCPQCLAGDGSLIQQRHGGPWSLLWRLPVVFACPIHHRLLEHTCPSCHQPAHHHPAGTAHLLPLATRDGLHPAQCRNPISDPSTTERGRACEARLDNVAAQPPLTDHDDHLGLQQRLLDLLRATGTDSVVSVGQETTPARYFVDLRIVSCLITSSWPAARDLTQHHEQAGFIGDHVRRVRQQIRRVRRSGRAVREIAFYDKPPLESEVSAHLFTVAERILAEGDVDTVRMQLRPLTTEAPPGTPNWSRQFLAGEGYCSPGLQAALGTEVGNQHVMKNVGFRLRAPSPPPQPVRFSVQHIPQHLLPEWHTEHLAGITEVKPQLLRRAAAAHLAQVCVGGSAATAAEFLGIPYDASINALTVVKQQLHGRSRRHFDTAVRSIAQHLDNTTSRTDYGNRRDALKTWSISPEEWATLIAGLQDQPLSGIVRTHIDWDDSKRILASIWVWVHITHGEHIFAPPIRPRLDQRRPSNTVRRHIHSRWPLINAEHPAGHYIALRERLVVYATQLAIDRQTMNR